MLDLNKEITRLRQIPEIGQYLGSALQLLQDGANDLAKHLGADAAKTAPAPPTIQTLNVKTNGTGLVHATIQDNNAISKNLHYFMEYSSEPTFQQPHIKFMGPSRSVEPFNLPAFNDAGSPQAWYFRAYSQYPGGAPGSPVHFGGNSPVGLNPGGTQRLTLLPSTGSGTAAANGQEGGSGFGKVLFRQPIGAKRTKK